MSIVTYENVDTPVFEIDDFLRYLFANGEQGSFWGPLPYYSDAAGTVEADWGDPVGNIPDASGNGTAWTQVTSTARPILRDSPPRLDFDGTDDQVTTTLPAISGGTIVLAGTNGIWIDELNFAGGAFSVGPDTYTGGPTGLMPILGDLLVEGGFVIDRALTPEEIAKVKKYYKARGSAGLFQWGDELVGDPEFDTPSYWTTAGNISITGGQCVFEEVTDTSDYCFRAGLLTFPGYFRAVWNVSSLSGGIIYSLVGQGAGGSSRTTSEAGSLVHYAHLPEAPQLNRLRISRSSGATPVNATIDSVSLRKLELIP